MKNEEKTIGELLALYPHGFSVTPGGLIQKTLAVSSRLPPLLAQYPVAPINGGYLVVELCEEDEARGDK